MKKTLLIVAMFMIAATMAFASGDAENKKEATTQEIRILNWLTGSERDLLIELEEAFVKVNPQYTIADINTAGGSGDPRSGIRTALLAGERYDVMMSTWPAFEQELADAELLLPVKEYWDSYNWGSYLNESWESLGSFNSELYTVYFLAGNRSALWYRTDVMENAGVMGEAATLEEWLGDLEKIQASGVTPLTMGAKSWAHTEWFENTLLKTAGVAFADKLTKREVAWTAPEVTDTFKNLRKFLKYALEPNTLLSLEWDESFDQVMRSKEAAYNLMGNWVNNTAQDTYELTPGEDYSFMMFPAINDTHAKTMSIDGKSLVILANAPNPDGGAAFIDFVLSAEGSKIIADFGITTPSSSADLSAYDSILTKYLELSQDAEVFFVLDDLLPPEMSSEFRIQLQEFLLDNSDANIAKIQQNLEDAAKRIY